MKWSDFETYLSELNIQAILNKWGYTVENVMKIQETLNDISGFFFVGLIRLIYQKQKRN